MTNLDQGPQPPSSSDTCYDPVMKQILEAMLEADEDITARGVIRRHTGLNAASSITRSEERSKMLAEYQTRQEEFRGWRGRLAKRSKESAAMSMAEKDIQIAELQRRIELLTASHVAMLRAVGELGGFGKWTKFFDSYQHIRDELWRMAAMPDAKVLPIEKRDK